MSPIGAVECWKCKASNPTEKRFCGDCGSPLDPLLGPLQETIQTSVRDEIRSALKEQLKDQKLLEYETADLVQTRVFGWAKNVGFVLAIAVAIAGFGLTGLGISTWKE